MYFYAYLPPYTDIFIKSYNIYTYMYVYGHIHGYINIDV